MSRPTHTNSPETLPRGYFDAMYASAPDPWGFADRWYEDRKYAISVAMLPQRHYYHGFEPGCSIGVLTQGLAARCGSLLACDAAPAAVQEAATRTRHLPHVRVEQRMLPSGWPSGTFDLIVLSELLYYFSDDDLRQVIDRTVSALRPGGSLLAVHWLHPVADYPRSGADVHQRLATRPGLARLAEHREPDFLAEVYLRTDTSPVSVAQAAGLA
jgi:SAM-dependent methyltransferase